MRWLFCVDICEYVWFAREKLSACFCRILRQHFDHVTNILWEFYSYRAYMYSITQHTYVHERVHVYIQRRITLPLLYTVHWQHVRWPPRHLYHSFSKFNIYSQFSRTSLISPFSNIISVKFLSITMYYVLLFILLKCKQCSRHRLNIRWVSRKHFVNINKIFLCLYMWEFQWYEQMCVEFDNNAAADICRVDFNTFTDGAIFIILVKRRARYSWYANNNTFLKYEKTHTHD